MKLPNSKIADINMRQIKMLIAGGCFPVQDNIKEDDLYHQIMRKKLLEQYCINLVIDILRYEDINNSMELIKTKAALVKPDILLFHLRAEPVLPKIKIYNVYTSRTGWNIRSIRIFSKIIFRTSEVSKVYSGNSSSNRTGKFHNVLRELNYLSGILAFNSLTLKNEFTNLVKELTEYCSSVNIELIMTGPVSRPRSYLENWISEKIDGYVRRLTRGKNGKYINVLGMETDSEEFLFCKDLIKVNEAGHRRIADLLLRQMIPILDFRK